MSECYGVRMRIVAIIDIDTTIANNDHRAVLLRRECVECKMPMPTEHRPTCANCGGTKHRTPQGAWDQFLQPDLMLLDDPQPHSLDVINFMRKHGYTIVFMTGRNETHRTVTQKWLEKHNYWQEGDQLIMRPKTDAGTPASQMKEKMFLEYRYMTGAPEDQYLFFEDDRYVLGTWQEYGLVFVCPAAWEHMNPVVEDRTVEPVWNR